MLTATINYLIHNHAGAHQQALSTSYFIYDNTHTHKKRVGRCEVGALKDTIFVVLHKY